VAFKVQVGPPQIAIHQGQTVLVTDPDGTITWPSEKGLYFLHDLRIGKHMLDIRFWREGEHTSFDVIKGDRKLVERHDSQPQTWN
jgi:hypothetical protein